MLWQADFIGLAYCMHFLP